MHCLSRSQIAWALSLGALLISPFTLNSQHQPLARPLADTASPHQPLQLAFAPPLLDQDGLRQLLAQFDNPDATLTSTKIGTLHIGRFTTTPWEGGADAPSSRCTPYIGAVYMGAVQESIGSTSWTISTDSGGTIIANSWSISDSSGTLGSGTLAGGNGVVTVSRAPVSQPTIQGDISVSYSDGSSRGRCSVTVSFEAED